jgi:OmpA-OmpF porin, OOP family
MGMIKRWIVCSAVLLAPGLAAAGDEVGQVYINPQVGGFVSDYRRDAHDQIFPGFGLGYNFSKYFSAEINWNRVVLPDRFDSGTVKLHSLSGDLLGVLNRGRRFAPFISIGGGAVEDSPSFAMDSKHAMEEAGLGMLIKLWEAPDDSVAFSLRPEIKARFEDYGHSHTTDYLGLVGFQLSFGKGTPPPPAAAAPPPPPPPPPPPVAQAAPPPPPVNPRCPEGAPPGAALDQFGCPEKGSITLEGVNFETNSATLTTDSYPVLDKVADGLVKHPRLRVEVQGHTDSTGAKAYNMSLSAKRADAVREYLLHKGVNTQQMVSKGYGPTEPVASNATKAGRAANRRVVMQVLENPGDVEVKGAGSAEIQ